MSMTTSMTQLSQILGSPQDSSGKAKLSAKDSAELAAWVKSEYGRMKSARLKLQIGWYLNMAFYYGNQYVELIPSLQKLGVPKVPPYRVRLVSNRIRPIIRKEIARLTAQKPSASVIPSTSDDKDMFAAYAAEAMWESLSTHGKLEAKFRRTMWWMCMTGTSFIKTWWDPNKTDMSGNQGDICYAPVTPFHLYVPDLREEEIEDQPYILNVYTKPQAWVQRFYKLNVNPDAVAANEILSDAYLNINSGIQSNSVDSVLCLELWAKPGAHKLLPDGGTIHIIGDQVIAQGPLYQHGMYPFVKFTHIPTGKFYGESVIVDLVPLQREFNRTRSQITEAKNRMGKPQLLAAKGSVDPKKITTEPGLIIEHTPGLPEPKPLVLQPLPSYIINELDRHIMDMEDISGQHEVSKGNTPPGVTAATAISYLQEQDDSLLAHTYADIESGYESLAKQTLSLAQQFWDMPRTIRTVGTDGTFDALMLSGADINGGTDIRMEGGSSLPVSKAAKQALIMDMMKMGFIQPDDGLRILDMGGVTKLWQNLRIDYSQAQRENIKLRSTDPSVVAQAQQQAAMIKQQMQSGQPLPPSIPTDTQTGQPLMPGPVVPVNTWDNHDTHITVHNNFRKTQAFEVLDPAIKQAFDEHVNMHLAAISSSLQQIQQSGGPAIPPPNPMDQSAPPVAGPPIKNGGGMMPPGNEMGAPTNG